MFPIPSSAIPADELKNLRQAFGDARKAFAGLTDLTLNSEHTLLTKVLGESDYSVKLSVMFSHVTVPEPFLHTTIVPTFTLHDWPKGRILAHTTTLTTDNLYLAHSTMYEKLDAYCATKTGQAAMSRHAKVGGEQVNPAPEGLTHFGGNDPTGYDDPDAALPPKSQRTLRRLHLLQHLDQLVSLHNGAFIDFNKSEAQSIPALFGLPRGTKAEGPGPNVQAEVDGFRIVRQAKLPARGRNGQHPSPASFSYQYSITRTNQPDVAQIEEQEPAQDPDTSSAATVVEGTEGVRASAALVAAAQGPNNPPVPNDEGPLLTHEEGTLRELDKIQSAVDRLRLLHEDNRAAHARIAELDATNSALHGAIGILQEKLTKSQAQLKALIDLA